MSEQDELERYNAELAEQAAWDGVVGENQAIEWELTQTELKQLRERVVCLEQDKKRLQSWLQNIASKHCWNPHETAKHALQETPIITGKSGGE